MGRRRGSGDKPKKRKKVPIELIERKHAGKIVGVYRILEELIDAHHPHLKDAKIALAWRKGWNEDADGRLRLGTCKKCSDLDRELREFDFVISLNKEVFAQSAFGEEKQRAVIDHELCHAAVSIDANGQPKTDEKGRTVYRLRKHDLEEFSEVVYRHGCYRRDVEAFGAAMLEAKSRPLIAGGSSDAGGAEPQATATQAATPVAISGFAGAALQPVANGTEAPAKEDWRLLPLKAAGINGAIGKKLAEHGIETIGALAKRTEEKGQWWYQDITGFGEASAEKVANSLTDFWKDHPEYCEDTK